MSEHATSGGAPSQAPAPGGVFSQATLSDRAFTEGAFTERRMYRPESGRHISGVASGLAIHLRLPVRYVRIAFVLTTLFGGAGVPVYLVLWALTPAGYQVDPATGQAFDAGGQPGRWRQRLTWPVVLVMVGVVMLASGPVMAGTVGLGPFSPTTLLALVALVAGAVIAWSHLDDTERRAWFGLGGSSRGAIFRVLIGAFLAAAGALVLVTRGQGVTLLGDVLVATFAVIAGLVLVLAPWGLRFWRRLQAEQATSIRESERASIAAHLHDSVLQTLALIQRTEDPTRVAQLARAQERELRTWLYGRGVAATDSLATAAVDAAADVEELHGTPIDLVVTGDRPLCEHTDALVRALREALLNAVRHGAAPVSAYIEVQPRTVEAFVRDHGPGFDLDDIAPDRLGVRESILGRMERAGGHARIRRLESGTEVALELPVDPPEKGGEAQRQAVGSHRETVEAGAERPAPDSIREPSAADPVPEQTHRAQEVRVD